MKIPTEGRAGGCRPCFSLLSEPSHHPSVRISATGALFHAGGMAPPVGRTSELSQSVKESSIT